MQKFEKNEINCKKYMEEFEKLKYENKEYLRTLENILDRLDNIKNKDLKLDIIYKIHRLEKIVSQIAVDLTNKNIKDFKKNN